MSVVIGRPPNFDQILAAFPNADKPGVIFTYGGEIYNPDGVHIPAALMAHEYVHIQRQCRYLKPEHWWGAYIADPVFRYTEELFAHVAEFKAQAHGIDRNQRAQLLMSTARRLVAPLYNYVPPRSVKQAISDLQEEIGK
jgi:hypothetical protein